MNWYLDNTIKYRFSQFAEPPLVPAQVVIDIHKSPSLHSVYPEPNSGMS